MVCGSRTRDHPAALAQTVPFHLHTQDKPNYRGITGLEPFAPVFCLVSETTLHIFVWLRQRIGQVRVRLLDCKGSYCCPSTWPQLGKKTSRSSISTAGLKIKNGTKNKNPGSFITIFSEAHSNFDKAVTALRKPLASSQRKSFQKLLLWKIKGRGTYHATGHIYFQGITFR